jgi:response regulator RpfG family c-di-GMP phosphodiesterase
MNEHQRTVLCVDDEKNILSSLKRLLRKEGYRLLTATSGPEGLKLFDENGVHLVISDQRMPQMSGTEFLSVVKERYPDTIRVVLTGYTDVDAITESINKGHVYKFLLKPWNDQSLKLEIRQALDQYDLIQANKLLDQKVLQQNEELKRINENLEALVQERTKELEIQNQALELSQAVLEGLPMPIMGVSAEGLIVLINREAQILSCSAHGIQIGKGLADYFSTDVQEQVTGVLATNTPETVKGYRLSNEAYDVDLTPLSGKFRGKGIILMLRQVEG